jgi:hypothetical protein
VNDVVHHSYSEDTGLTQTQLWGLAWFLGILGTIAWFRVAVLLDGPGSVDLTLGTWLACAALATTCSACCAVVASVKAAETRIRSALANEIREKPLP